MTNIQHKLGCERANSTYSEEGQKSKLLRNLSLGTCPHVIPNITPFHVFGGRLMSSFSGKSVPVLEEPTPKTPNSCSGIIPSL